MSIPAPVQRYRARSCGTCPQTDCPSRNSDDPCAACPLSPPAWGKWDCGNAAPKMTGLGDAVAVVAQPIARTIDRAAAAVGIKTNVAGCGGCKARQAALNKAVPFN